MLAATNRREGEAPKALGKTIGADRADNWGSVAMCILCAVSGHTRTDHFDALDPAARATAAAKQVALSGNPNVDGLLTGSAWNVTALTYAFPTEGSQFGDQATYGDNAPFNNFQPLSAQAQAATADALAMAAEYTNLTFTLANPGEGVIQNGFSAEVGGGAYAFVPGNGA
ncbi:MAG: hypothetical protein AAF321_12785, partial [Pseudomonadota bacterium]